MERQEKWDRRFISLAKHVAGWSKDPSTKTGAVIVDSRMRVVSIGYNGFPPGICDDERLNDRSVKYDIIVHCERNAVVNAGRSVVGCTLYTWPFFGCTPCGSLMLSAGLVRAVAPVTPEYLRDRWDKTLEQAKSLWLEAGAQVTIL